MSNQSKRIVWKKSDYAREIFILSLHFLFLVALILVAIVVKGGGFSNFANYFTKIENVKVFVFGAISIIFLLFISFIYFYNEKRDFIYKNQNITMVYFIIVLSVVVTFLFGRINTYLKPFAICALLTLFVTDKKTAIFMNMVFSAIMLVMDIFTYGIVKNTLISPLITFVVGSLAVFIVDGEGSRMKVLAMGIFVSLPVMVVAVCLEYTLQFNSTLKLLLYALGSGILSVSLVMIILPFIEIVFEAVTNFRLTELTDHKVRLIKGLIENAPGTFSHTQQVATLAEACSNAIGENPLVARACSYYHDIGKVKNPLYFTENQAGKNLHDDLTPELSTDIIKSHAKDGAALIRKRRLPSILADACEQHHGTMPIKYFYAKAKKFTDGDLDIDNFCYAGPKPQTKINAIIMICDASEAKVRTLNNRTHENVDKAVREIIEERIELDQFTECDITLRELDIIRNTITNTLAGLYHGRVKYPKLKVGKKNGN